MVKDTKHKCPGCGVIDNVADSLDSTKPSDPSPGDTTICIYCSTISIFTEDLTLRYAERDEIAEVIRDPTARKALKEIRKMRERGEIKPPPEDAYNE